MYMAVACEVHMVHHAQWLRGTFQALSLLLNLLSRKHSHRVEYAQRRHTMPNGAKNVCAAYLCDNADTMKALQVVSR
jgi:hypothetical protein